MGDEIVLRSARLGRRVIPRLTSAHNYSGHGQGAYRFLCEIQGQGTTADRLSWDWGSLEEAAVLPRVVAGRLMLALAQWRAAREELQVLVQAQGADRYRAVQIWRARRRLPRWVQLAERDNTLPIDLNNTLSIDAFLDGVKGREQVILLEMFPSPDELCVQGPEGRFVHQLVVPFVRSAPLPRLPTLPSSTLASTPSEYQASRSSIRCSRRFPLGSEWLYAKLYAGPVLVDQLLRQVVQPVTEAVLSSGAADGWFFIRYADPEEHLRLRFHGEPRRLQNEVLPALQTAVSPLMDDGRVWRLQLDTYEREVERYGGTEGIVLAERLFQVDSETVLSLMDLVFDDPRSQLRCRLALLGIHQLLVDLGFELNARHALLRRMREGFAHDFRADVALKRQLGDKYRKERGYLEAMLTSECAGEELIKQGKAILQDRSTRWTSLLVELRDHERTGRLTLSLSELATSFIHMHVNRLLRSAQRAHEMVLYDYLYRLYESQTSRGAINGPPQ